LMHRIPLVRDPRIRCSIPAKPIERMGDDL
jgi:hypothetical protein